MLRHIARLSLLVATLALVVSARPSTTITQHNVNTAESNVEMLPPIHGFGIARDTFSKRDQMSNPQLQDSINFYWGPSIENPILNYTTIAKDQNQRYLGMENFANIISSASCGPSDRTPYTVQAVSFIDQTWTAKFSAQKGTWETAVQDWLIYANSRGIMANSNNLLLANANVTGALHKRLTAVDKKFSIDLTQDFSNKNIVKTTIENNVQLSLDCVTCGTKGSLDFEVSAGPDIFFPFFFATAKLTPNNVEAFTTIGLTASGSLQDTKSFTQTLLAVPLPGGFGTAGGPLFIGPSFDVAAVAELTKLSAEATIQAGIMMSVPNSAIAQLGVNTDTKFSGWTPTFTPIPPSISGQLEVAFDVTPRSTISLDVQIPGFGLTAGLALNAPEVKLDLIAQANSAGGVCGNPNADIGVSVEIDLAAELDAFAGQGKVGDQPNKVDLISTQAQLFSSCFTVAGASSTTMAAPPTQTTATSGPVQVNLFLAQDCSDSAAFAVSSDGKDASCHAITGNLAAAVNGVRTNTAQCTILFFSSGDCNQNSQIANVVPMQNQCVGQDSSTNNFSKAVAFEFACGE
ncbi:hypothetical protein BT63DRAFT_427909 [Microthyrium microscopicum]|uniref:DUF7223 domain-containing protein n=1 Tax=Microthyrium microscopicum TaxID=703497 RepID=A0A6A6U4Q9_9PEZI|nr:hypothetical protein BT63DRAFT_427909 [Microthyrium microscopicum]